MTVACIQNRVAKTKMDMKVVDGVCMLIYKPCEQWPEGHSERADVHASVVSDGDDWVISSHELYMNLDAWKL